MRKGKAWLVQMCSGDQRFCIGPNEIKLAARAQWIDPALQKCKQNRS